MRYFAILCFAAIVTVSGAETTNSLRLKSTTEEAQKLATDIRAAQDQLLRLEGVIATLSTIVEEENTSAGDTATTR